VFWKSWYHHSTDERFERATWHGKTKLLPDERKRDRLCTGGSRKHGVSLSVDGKLLQNVADDNDKNAMNKMNEQKLKYRWLKIIFASDMYV
jgi:hypothetical protein